MAYGKSDTGMAVIAVDAGINIRPATSSRLTQSKTAAGKQGDNVSTQK